MLRSDYCASGPAEARFRRIPWGVDPDHPETSLGSAAEADVYGGAFNDLMSRALLPQRLVHRYCRGGHRLEVFARLADIPP